MEPTRSYDRSIDDYAAGARDFCSWLEVLKEITPETAPDMIRKIMTLYIVSSKLEAPEEFDDVTTDYTAQLLHFASPKDIYWEIYDPYGLDGPVASSLSDDLNDIYRSVLSGLTLYDAGHPQDALLEWQWGFSSHWRYHAADAIRALTYIDG